MEGVHPLLDAGPAGVVDPDHRHPHLDRHVLHLDDLDGVGLAQAAPGDREILGEDENGPALDRAVAGDHPVGRDLHLVHAEVVAAVLDEGVELHEGVGIQQEIEPLPGRKLALLVLLGGPLAVGVDDDRRLVLQGLDQLFY